MSRAYGEIEVINRVGKALSGVAVDLLDPVTLLRIGDTVFADNTSATTLSLPLTTDQNGKAQFYLTSGRLVVTRYTDPILGGSYDDTIAVIDPTAPASGGGSVATHSHVETDVSNLPTDLASKAAVTHGHIQTDVTGLGTALGLKANLASTEQTVNKGAVNGYAGLDGSGKVPSAQLPTLGTTFAGDTDVAVTTPSVNQELVYNNASPTKVINILHRYRPQGYVGFAADGATDGTGTDNSTVLATMMADANSAGRGFIEFPNRVIACKNVPIYPNAHIDLNGATLVQVSGSTTSDDLVRANNFNTNSGTATSVSGGTVPYNFTIENGTMFQPNGLGRNVMALYGYSFTLKNLKLFSSSVGAGLWTEYGTTTEVFSSGSPPSLYGDAGMYVERLTIIDAPSTSAVNTAPAGNDMSLSVSAVTNTTNPTITTTRPHYLVAGMTIVITGVVGATGVNTTLTVLAVTGSTTFTVTLGSAPGVYTSGGTMTYHVSAGWTNLGPHDAHACSVLVIASGYVGGRRGILNGKNGGGSSNTGMGYEHLHVYGNWSVALDNLSSNLMFSGDTQLEAAHDCVHLIRTGGRVNMAGGSIYGGFGGVTLLDIRQANQNQINAKMMLGGSGNAPPTGFNNTYLYTSSTSDDDIKLLMQHDYATTVAATAGTIPTHSYLNIYMDDFGGGTLTAGWLTSIDATHAGIAMIPTGLTVTTG